MPIERRPPLSAELVRKLFDYDPEIGVLFWRTQPDKPRKWNTRYAGTPAGSFVRGHLQIQVSNPEPLNYYAHRIAWCHFYGYWPPDQIDHIDRQRANNRIANLRMASHSDNCCNKFRQKNNTSGIAGVTFHKASGKWRARINRNGVKVFDALFDSIKDAAAARRGAIAEFHGEFANHDRPSELDRG